MQRRDVDWQAARRGTLQHEVLEGDGSAIDIGSTATLELPVFCAADAGPLDESIPYALAVTREVSKGASGRVYDEIRARIAPRVVVRL